MATGKKLAVLVGCNYHHLSKVQYNISEDQYKLYGCINDVKAMKALLTDHFGFPLDNIAVLTDDTSDPSKMPTFLNIKNELVQMIKNSGPGDILLFYFSGNGTLLKPSAKNETYKESIPAIVCCDLFPITAADLLPLLKPLPDDAIFTFVCDSSYSGGLFDKKDQIEYDVPGSMPNLGLKTIHHGIVNQPSNLDAKLPDVSAKNRILLSSSNANEQSVEVYPNGDKSKAFGVFTNGVQLLLNTPPKPSNNNWDAVTFPATLLGWLGFNQHPFLWCTDDNKGAPFLG